MPPPARAPLALSYLAFVSLGLPDTVIGVAWPSIRDTFGLSQAGLGVALGAGVAGYALSGAVAGRLVQALGVGRLLAASSGAVSLGLVAYAVAPVWPLFVAAAPLIGAGSGAIDAALNGFAARHFPVRHVNWLHACWSAGATAGPALMTAVLAWGASFRTGYGAIAAVLAAMTTCFVLTRRAWDDGPGPRSPGARPGLRGGARAALSRPRVWLQIAIFFVYTGLEAGTGQWCFTVLRDGRGVTLETAGAWTAAYWGSIGLGRVVLGFVIGRVGPDRLLRIASLSALAGAAAFAASEGLMGRLGLVLLGASLAPMYPTLMARSPGRLGAEVAPHAVGFQVTAATLGSAAVPAALGVLAARAGVGAIAPAVAAVAAVHLAIHEVLLAETGR
ncbi:MAG TPA: MFS transporter [Anaeromyxobacter sp.]